ncbi:MAG: hypothetical protein ACRETU_12780 [Steroidobacterales bacterium]
MWHDIVLDDKFWAELGNEDARIAARVKAGGCVHCGGRLDHADYPRKPRGGGVAQAGERMVRRTSFCCAKEGCRLRETPPSLVFLGRRVYLGIAVLVWSLRVAQAAWTSSSPPRRTVGRWVEWFREQLPKTDLFVAARGRLWPPISDGDALPGVLVERFAKERGSTIDALVATLRFLSPLRQTRSARLVRVG